MNNQDSTRRASLDSSFGSHVSFTRAFVHHPKLLVSLWLPTSWRTMAEVQVTLKVVVWPLLMGNGRKTARFGTMKGNRQLIPGLSFISCSHWLHSMSWWHSLTGSRQLQIWRRSPPVPLPCGSRSCLRGSVSHFMSGHSLLPSCYLTEILVRTKFSKLQSTFKNFNRYFSTACASS